MSSKTHIAVIGAGWWATAAHIPALLAHPDAELAALCDLDAAKAKKTAKAFGVERWYSDVQDLLDHEDLDGVVVATNHAAHYESARPCLEKGIHTLIEKPMTLHAAHAKELIDLAAANGCAISIGYNANYAPYAVRARELVQSGRLGPVQYLSGIFSQHVLPLLQGKGASAPGFQDRVHSPGDVYSDPERSGGGHGHLQLTHLLGLLFHLTGLKPQSVTAQMDNHGLAVDLVNALLVAFEGGALAAIGGTSNNPGNRKFDLQVYCEQGWIDIDDAAGSGRFGGVDWKQQVTHPEGSDRSGERFASTNNLVDRILGKAPNRAPGEAGWRAVEVLEAAYRSAEQDGRRVFIEELYP